MCACPSIEQFIRYLKNESHDDSFLSDFFIAVRDKEKNLLTGRESFISHYKKLIDEGIIIDKVEQEDSHYLLFYKLNNIEHIMKIKLDSNKQVMSTVEEIYRENQRNTVIVVEYDGSNYYGMQKQDNHEAVQDKIEKALKEMLNKEVITFPASRTDRGVHAKGQVIHFDSMGIPPIKYKGALNRLLPKDIRVIDAYDRSQLFHARYDVIQKEYQYIIDMGEYSVFNKDYVWYQKINNLPKIREELKSLIGTHDFVCFCKGEKEDTVRTIYDASFTLAENRVIFKFIGSGFLHNMIRLIMGSLIEIDKTGIGSIKSIIDSKDKNLTSKIAPASGLYLVRIDY